MKQYAYLEALVQALIAKPSDECFDWPNRTVNGYGAQITYQGKPHTVHRLALAMKLRRSIAPGMDASHTCGRRGCVNPWHLMEKSRKDTMADRAAHSTSNRHLGLRLDNVSRYKGVSFYEAKKKRRAQIGVNGRQMHLGYHDSAEDGARAYDAAVLKFWGPGHYMNLPDQRTGSVVESSAIDTQNARASNAGS